MIIIIYFYYSTKSRIWNNFHYATLISEIKSLLFSVSYYLVLSTIQRNTTFREIPFDIQNKFCIQIQLKNFVIITLYETLTKISSHSLVYFELQINSKVCGNNMQSNMHIHVSVNSNVS